jgi:hypothetical protein
VHAEQTKARTMMQTWLMGDSRLRAASAACSCWDRGALIALGRAGNSSFCRLKSDRALPFPIASPAASWTKSVRYRMGIGYENHKKYKASRQPKRE